MMSFFNRKRTPLGINLGESVQVLTDLDRIISTPVGFRWKGRIHQIKPMSNEVFLSVLRDLARIHEVNRSGMKQDNEKMLRVYAALFMDVCDTITYDDVKEMLPAQVTALFSEIMDCVKGKTKPDEAQKKTPEMAS